MGVSPKAFQQMQSRLEGGKREPQPLIERSPAPRPAGHEVILGIDPSLRGTGFGVIRVKRREPEALVQGVVCCPAAWERSRCLAEIGRVLRQVAADAKPDVCVVEGLFYAQNLKTALIMGEARGAALAAVAELGLEIYEIAPRKVKQAIVGYGGAQKPAVARMVQRMLNLTDTPAPDAADALALALTHAREQGPYRLSSPKRI